MTIPNTAVWRTEEAGNGVKSLFTFPHRFLADADLVVRHITTATSVAVKDPLVLTTDYTVVGAGTAASGSITLTAAYIAAHSLPAASTKIVIENRPVIEQQIDYVPGDAFPESTHEDALDKLTIKVRELSERIDRSIVIRDGDSNISASSEFQAGGAQIGGLAATPVDADHATSKAYVDSLALLGVVNIPVADAEVAASADIDLTKLNGGMDNAGEMQTYRSPGTVGGESPPLTVLDTIQGITDIMRRSFEIIFGISAGTKHWYDTTYITALTSSPPIPMPGYAQCKIAYATADTLNLTAVTKQNIYIEMNGVLYVHDVSGGAFVATIGSPATDLVGWKHLYAKPSGTDFTLSFYDDAVATRPEISSAAGDVGYGKGTGPLPAVTERYLCSVYNDASNDIVPFDIIDGWMIYRTIPAEYTLQTASGASYASKLLLAADVPTNVVGAVRLNVMWAGNAVDEVNGFYARGDKVGTSVGSAAAPTGATQGTGSYQASFAGGAMMVDIPIEVPSAPEFAQGQLGGAAMNEHRALLHGWKPLIPFAHTE